MRILLVVPIVALVAVAVALPYVVYPIFLSRVLCFALFAVAFNIMMGHAGMLAFGHAMFFGGSAYLTGYLLKSGYSTEVAVVAGVVLAFGLGAGTGYLAIRRRGIYFSMITLAVAQMFYFLCSQLSFTGGEEGMSSIPRGKLFGVMPLDDDKTVYYVVLVVVTAAILLVHRVGKSLFGEILRGSRDNEARVISLGYDVQRFRLLAFVLSAALAGLAGSLKVVTLQLVTLYDVSWVTSGDVVLMVLIGGTGSIFGPVVGTLVIVGIHDYLTGFGEWVIALQGLILFIAILSFRRGLVGEIPRLFASGRRRVRADL